MVLDPYAPNSPVLTAAFPHLSIKRKLGEGGFKHVYEAVGAQGVVAFKVVKPTQDHERTLREVMAASRFMPPRFPHVFDQGQAQVGTDNVVFIVEEFIQGDSLRSHLGRGLLSEVEALHIGRELLDALSDVAAQRLVHRDVKPENIMLGPSGRVVLLDFGIARHLLLNSLTLDVALFGPLTPGYGAPEQIKNEKRSISPRTDLFAWGVVMYEMLIGHNPFIQRGATVPEVLTRTLTHQPPQLTNCSPELAKAVDWCLQKAPHRRPTSPAIVRAML